MTALYFLIGAVYADICLVRNIADPDWYDSYKFPFKLFCYAMDTIFWPVVIVGMLLFNALFKKEH